MHRKTIIQSDIKQNFKSGSKLKLNTKSILKPMPAYAKSLPVFIPALK